MAIEVPGLLMQFTRAGRLGSERQSLGPNDGRSNCEAILTPIFEPEGSIRLTVPARANTICKESASRLAMRQARMKVN
jgi:hypothetical protein